MGRRSIMSLLCIACFIGMIIKCEDDSSQCGDGELLVGTSCKKCKDEECSICLRDERMSCYLCKGDYILSNGRCGRECDLFTNCDTCSVDRSECIHCSKSCELKDGQCNCTTMIVIIIVCVAFGIIVLALLIYCLTKPARLQMKMQGIEAGNTRGNVGMGNVIQMTTQPAQESTNINSVRNNEPMENQGILDEMFEMYKVDSGDLGDKQICDYCCVTNADYKLECGCFICSEHLKNIEQGEKMMKCPSCLKEIHKVIQITCGICFQYRRELSKFKCQCSLMICRNCYMKLQREKTTNCPACRALISS